MSRRSDDPQAGAAVVEYALLVALVAGVVVGGVTSVGQALGVTFEEVCAELAGTGAPGNSGNTPAAGNSHGQGGQSRC
ncbi:MAG: Flp family type IVb pilin [Actinomycetota bacterium]|nr:Flp family type IVb pilin [Actinomycetota bacterium]